MTNSDIFINNKYYKWYCEIIIIAESRTIDDYTEHHHIIPKSLGGSNKKDNLVSLTAREHFVCHLLLTKITEGENKKKMARAFWLMAKGTGNRYKPSSKLYEIARKSFVEAQKGHSNYLKFQTQDSRTQISITMKKMLSELTQEENSQRTKNSWSSSKSWTDERKKKISKSTTGKKKTKTPKLLAAEAARKNRTVQQKLKCGAKNKDKTWKIINGKRVWMEKQQ